MTSISVASIVFLRKDVMASPSIVNECGPFCNAGPRKFPAPSPGLGKGVQPFDHEAAPLLVLEGGAQEGHVAFVELLFEFLGLV